MSILLPLAIGFHALAWAIADPACRHLVPVARKAMAEALDKYGVALPVPWFDDERFWVAGRDEADASRCVVGWGGNPTGGGHHGAVLIELANGRVLSVSVGRHLR